ncbi:MAG: hypothetical protein KJN71_05530 [Acidimicrobiia bacterium]|nr:hypothetical protein [Acidimicrobiia bacterium]NNC75964.1 hypothetical protein [Acidimicrobiia bacterium]
MATLERERVEERRRVLEAPERRERLPEPPPPARGLMRWIILTTVTLALIAGAIVAAVIDTSDTTEAYVPEEAASELSIGARHLDADFTIPERWVGLSEVEPAVTSMPDDHMVMPAILGPMHVDPEYVAPDHFVGLSEVEAPVTSLPDPHVVMVAVFGPMHTDPDYVAPSFWLGVSGDIRTDK